MSDFNCTHWSEGHPMREDCDVCEIRALKARIRKLEAEVERLNARPTHPPTGAIDYPRMVSDLRAEVERLRDKLSSIEQWCEAYPVEVFPEPTKEEWRRLHELAKANGLHGIDRFSASCMRRIIDGWKEHAALTEEAKP